MVYEALGTALVTAAFTLTNKDSQVRGFAYLIAYLVGFRITGAAYNPATSLAVFVTNKLSGKGPRDDIEAKQSLYQLLVLFAMQVLGSFFGIFLVYVLAKDYVNYLLFPIQNNDLYVYQDSFAAPGDRTGFMYARIFGQEVLQTFIFTLVFLSIRG